MISLNFLYSLINFLILLVLINLFFRKKIKSFLLSRRENYISKKEETQLLYKDAVEKLKKMKKKIETIEKEGEIYLNNISEKTKKEATLILKKAMNVRDRIVASRQKSLEADIKDFKKLIKSRTAIKILKSTENRIKEKSFKGLNEMYIDEYSELSKIERAIK
jgi:F-type H+-transporting ATPase subunit b